MKLFIWEEVNYLTDRWHNEGGCVIIAEDLNAARKLFLEDDNNTESKCDLLTEPPDLEAELPSDSEPRVFMFPNAGCC